MSRNQLRRQYALVCHYFLSELGKHLMNSFEECCNDCGDLKNVEEILPHSISWEDSVPSLIVLKVKERSGEERQHASQN